jgi:putative DNA primase/helicase
MFPYIFIEQGIGRNGKTILFDLMGNAMGEYWDTIDMSMWTRRARGGEGPSPQLAKTKALRGTRSDETERGDPLMLALLKRVTGGDKLTARFLRRNPITFMPEFTPFIIVNYAPTFSDATDFGGTERIVLFKYKIKFVDNPGPGECQKDPTLERKVHNPVWAKHFISLLVHYWKKLVADNYKLKIPQSVRRDTMEYIGQGDALKIFVEETIVKTDSIDSVIKLNDLFMRYSEWARLNVDRDKTVHRAEFIQYMKRLKPNVIKHLSLIRHRYKEPGEDEEEENEEEPESPPTETQGVDDGKDDAIPTIKDDDSCTGQEEEAEDEYVEIGIDLDD